MNLLDVQEQTSWGSSNVQRNTREWTSSVLAEAQTCCITRQWTSMVLVEAQTWELLASQENAHCQKFFSKSRDVLAHSMPFTVCLTPASGIGTNQGKWMHSATCGSAKNRLGSQLWCSWQALHHGQYRWGKTSSLKPRVRFGILASELWSLHAWAWKFLKIFSVFWLV